MNVIPPYVPVVPMSPDAVVRALPTIAGQAVAPQTQRAVDPSSKSDRGNQSRSNADRGKGGGRSEVTRGTQLDKSV